MDPADTLVVEGAGRIDNPTCKLCALIRVSVVRETVRPAYVSPWLRPDLVSMQSRTSDPAGLNVDEQGPAWSPGGKKIAFAKERGGNRDVHVMRADGSNQKRLTTDPALVQLPTWAVSRM